MAKNDTDTRLRSARRMTEAGRRRCAASGSKNLEAYRATLSDEPEAMRDIGADVAKWEQDVLAELPNLTPLRRAIVKSTGANLAILLQAKIKLISLRRWRRETLVLADLVLRAQGAFLRSLRALGVDLNDAPAGDPGDSETDLSRWIATHGDSAGTDGSSAAISSPEDNPSRSAPEL